MRIKLTCKNIKTDQTLIVDYNPYSWDHDEFSSQRKKYGLPR